MQGETDLKKQKKVVYKCVSELNFTSIVLSGIGSPFPQKKSQTLYPSTNTHPEGDWWLSVKEISS